MSLRDDLLFLRAAARSFYGPEEMSKCFSLIRQGSPYDQLFFRELSDPRWLPTLSEEGYFRRLPVPVTTEDGTTRYPWHLPLQGLLKIAATDSLAAATVLHRLHIPNNLAIHDQVLRVMAVIKEPPCVDEILPVLQWLLKTASNSSWLWLGDILANWIKHRKVDACFNAVAGFLDQAVASHEEGGPVGDRWRMDDLDNQIIVLLARENPLKMAYLLRDVLVAWAESERARIATDKSFYGDGYNPHLDNDYDHPGTYWLEDFTRTTFHDHNLEGVAAHRLYAIGKQLLESDADTDFGSFDDLLRSNRWHLFRRLRWQLYAEFPSKTLNFARQDVLVRIPLLREKDAHHGYEFAMMLEAQANTHRDKFLNTEELASFVDAVITGTVDEKGDEGHSRYTRRKQLNPIRQLLTGDLSGLVAALPDERQTITLESYKPFHSSGGEAHAVEQVAPPQAEGMSQMADLELWHFLNTWMPKADPNRTNFWKEESISALGNKFAEFVELAPLRFPPESRWWEHIQRPEILSATLERANKRLQEDTGTRISGPSSGPTEDEWRNWLGLVSQLVSTRPSDASSSAWEWPCILGIKFLTTTIRLVSSREDQQPELSSLNKLPEGWQQQTSTLLIKLFEDPDPRLDGRETAFMNAWLSTAINSVRGTALEGLLQLALYQRNKSTDDALLTQIFEAIATRLRSEDESPAIFAALGANLRLAVHLFSALIRNEPNTFLRPSRDAQRIAFISSHILYDRPMSEVVETLPDLPYEALSHLAEGQAGQDQMTGDSWREFGRRLGTHLGFYYWNQAYKNEMAAEAVIDRFFVLATPEARALCISDIGTVFSSVVASENNGEICERAMKLWDRRFAQIESALFASPATADGYRRELEEFADWIECECFPFGWRTDRVVKVVNRLAKAPRAYSILEALEKYSELDERLEQSIRVLHAIVSKPSDELRWSYQPAVLKKLLERGFSAINTSIRQMTADVQELLLRQGLFEYLDVEPHAPAT